jgi:hypothetical protein
VIVVIGGEGFVGGEDEVAVVEGGGGFLDPEIAIGDLAVAPAGDGGAVGIAVENVAEKKEAGGGFSVAFAFLESGLSRMKATAPSKTAAAEMDGDGGVGFYPGIAGGGAAVKLEGGVAGVPAVGDGEEEGAGVVGDGGGRERGGEKKKREEEKEAGHVA